MSRRASISISLAASLLLASVCALAQSGSTTPNAPACSDAPAATPCKTNSQNPQASPSTAERFPFPGEAPVPAAQPANPSEQPAASQPGAPASNDGSASKRFPFPGETPAPASSGSSSSSSSDTPDTPDTPDTSSPDAADADKPADAPSGRRLLKRVNPIGTKLQSPEEREAEDIDVAKYYLQTGDTQGAYLRSKDAVSISPDDPDAHCYLAQSAQKLNKRDEAITEFNACLKLDPVDKLAKEAKKELAKLK